MINRAKFHIDRLRDFGWGGTWKSHVPTEIVIVLYTVLGTAALARDEEKILNKIGYMHIIDFF